jgi:hypothetical protein
MAVTVSKVARRKHECRSVKIRELLLLLLHEHAKLWCVGGSNFLDGQTIAIYRSIRKAPKNESKRNKERLERIQKPIKNKGKSKGR